MNFLVFQEGYFTFYYIFNPINSGPFEGLY